MPMPTSSNDFPKLSIKSKQTVAIDLGNKYLKSPTLLSRKSFGSMPLEYIYVYRKPFVSHRSFYLTPETVINETRLCESLKVDKLLFSNYYSMTM